MISPFRWSLVVTAAFFLSYNTMLVLVPLFVRAHRGTTESQGLSTLSLMIAATIGPVVASHVARRVRLDVLMLVSIALMCLPIPLYLVFRAAAASTLLSLVRGFGFGAGCVVSGTLAAQLAERRSVAQAMAWYGAATAVVTLPGQAGGLWLADELGYTWTFLVAAVLPFLVSPALFAVVGRRHRTLGYGSAEMPRHNPRVGATLVSVAAAFWLAALLYGAVVTFLPAHLTSAGSHAITTLYFVLMGTALPIARLTVGRWLELFSTAVRLVSLALALGGTCLLAAHPSVPVAAAAGLLFGAGFGGLATLTQFRLTRLVPPARYHVANAYFAGSFNLGIGVGALAYGFGLPHTSFGMLSLVTSAVCGAGVLTTVAGSTRAPTPTRSCCTSATPPA